MQKTLLTTTLLVAFHLAWAQDRLTIQGDSLISLRGRQMRLNKQGFPEQIDSLLAENIHFHFTRQPDGKDIRLTSTGLHFTRQDGRRIEWNAISTSDELKMAVTAVLTAGGDLIYSVNVTALQDLEIKDITMHIPFQPDKALYLKGLGLPGGPRPDTTYRWKWSDHPKGPFDAWIGTDHAGMRYALKKGEAWENEGKGGITIGIKGKSMLVNNYSGPRSVRKGEDLSYIFYLTVMRDNKKI